MPGVKRKGQVGQGSKVGGKRIAHTGKRIRPGPDGREEDEDDFDDDVDLLAAANAANGQKEEESSGSSESYGSDDDRVEMFSDEDMDGGFVDMAQDGEEEGEEEDEGRAEGTQTNGKRKSLYAIPSRDEMSELKSTSSLFKSNIFRLKVEEMLNEVRPKYEKAGALEFVLRHLKTCLESIDPIGASLLPQAKKELDRRMKAKIVIPFPSPPPKDDSPLKFAFQPPEKVQIGGSWILKTAALRPEGVDVDVIVTMPSALFQEKDHLNFRYFYKRAFYLAVIASAILREPLLDLDCAFSSYEDDVRRSFLVLKPKRKSAQSDFSNIKAHIRLHLAHEPDLFPIGRLGPMRNNIRLGKAGDETDGAQAPTPAYNASILKDGLYIQHLLYLNATAAICGEFANASMLLKVWSSQRALGSGRSKDEVKGRASKGQERRIALGSSSVRFILTMILAHLLHGPEKVSIGSQTTSSSTISRLSPGFSSYQLFRGVIDFLANTTFEGNPMFMRGDVDGLISRREKIAPFDFAEACENVLVDPTGSINLLQTFSSGSFGFLQREAKTTLALLVDLEQDHFDSIFLRDLSKPLFSFDELFRINVGSVHVDELIRADDGSTPSAGLKTVSSTLRNGLSSRQALVTSFLPTSKTWQITDARPASSMDVDIAIDLIPAQAFRLVDHGPRPEEVEKAKQFKDFWGDLSELRRFRDGRIVESVVWTASGPFERLTIPRRIISHVLEHHYSIVLNASSDFMSSAFDNLLFPQDEELVTKVYTASPYKLGFQPIQSAFDELVKSLRGLQGLPLSLISVVASDPALRGTSCLIPGPVNVYASTVSGASFCPSMDFVMTFESSGQWPDDLAAIRAMKMAFYESMAVKLGETLSGCEARIAFDVDADENGLWDCSALEVLLPSGFAFRGRIHHAREETLLQRILDDERESGSLKSQAREALDRYDLRFIHAVRHHNYVAALSHRYPSFAEACRLMKRWIHGQLIGNQVAEELIELLVAYVYIESGRTQSTPAFGHVGFVQTLRLLASWDWKEAPLSVAMAGATSATPSFALSVDDLRRVQANFEKIRKLDPSMHHFAWFIATDDERKGACWAAHQGPTAGTADALQHLAKAACKALESQMTFTAPEMKGLFVASSLDQFDLVIHLEPAAINRYVDSITFDAKELAASRKRLDSGGKATSSVYRNLAGPREGQGIMPGLNVGLEFVQLLQSLYMDTFRLYYDAYGGTTIGCLFNPTLIKPRPFRVGLGFNSMPVNEPERAKDVTLNAEAIAEEIQRIGKGIVRHVALQQQHQRRTSSLSLSSSS